MGSLQQLANQQAAPPPPPPAPASTPIADDDYLTGRQFRDAVNQYGQNMGTALSGAYERVAELALDRLRSNYPTDFQKWGGEILSKIQSLPLHLRTLDTMETIVKLVRSEHLDEIAQMRAQELVSSGNLTLRSNGSAGGYPGGSGPGNPLESEKLDAGLRARLQRQGVTLETVREFCAKNGQTVESWLADAEKAGSGVIVDRGGMR